MTVLVDISSCEAASAFVAPATNPDEAAELLEPEIDNLRIAFYHLGHNGDCERLVRLCRELWAWTDMTARAHDVLTWLGAATAAPLSPNVLRS